MPSEVMIAIFIVLPHQRRKHVTVVMITASVFVTVPDNIEQRWPLALGVGQSICRKGS